MLNQILYLNPPSSGIRRIWIDFFYSCADRRTGLILRTSEDGIINLAKLGEVSRFTLNMHNQFHRLKTFTHHSHFD